MTTYALSLTPFWYYIKKWEKKIPNLCPGIPPLSNSTSKKSCYTALYPVEGTTAIAGQNALCSSNASRAYQTRALANANLHARKASLKQLPSKS